MGQLVKVKIRPGNELEFPAICVHCARPASEGMALRKRIGQATRFVDAPLCAECAQEVGRLGGEEERWLRLGRVVSVASALASALLSSFLLASLIPPLPAALTGLAVGALMGVGLWSLFRRRSLEAARPAKRAILDSARMADFSWRATTFEFENSYFAEEFRDLNQARLMDIPQPANVGNHNH